MTSREEVFTNSVKHHNGVVIGTYSSIYVASSMILALGISKEDLLPSEKEAKEIDARP